MDNKLVPLVFSVKANPMPWNGGSDSHANNPSDNSPGQSNIAFLIRPTGTAFTQRYTGGGTELGAWTSTPGTTYEYRSSVLSESITPAPIPGITTAISTSSDGNWVTIGGTYVQAAFVTCDRLVNSTAGISITTTFSIEIRKVGDTTPVVASTFTLSAVYETIF